MKTFIYSLTFIAILGLGLFGLLSVFFDHPMALVVQLIIIAAVIIIGLFLFQRLSGGREQVRYRKAARKSKKRFKQAASRRLGTIHASRLKVITSGNAHSSSRGFGHSSKPKREQNHLTVIDGKKNKKKKRVLF